jgi:hypothetical protein
MFDITDIFTNIEAAILEPPTITFRISCYHMERRTRSTKNGTKTYYVRVETFSTSKELEIKKWEERSPPISSLHFLNVLLLTRLTTDK